MGSALRFHVFATPFQPTHYRILALDHRVLLAAEGAVTIRSRRRREMKAMPRWVLVILIGWC